MRTLVDSSVWIDHFRASNANLVELLRQNEVLIHSAVIGKLACGNLHRRAQTLESLQLLPRATEAGPEDVLAFLDRLKLQGRGLGWVDVQLLASAALSGARLWTIDRRLARVVDHL